MEHEFFVRLNEIPDLVTQLKDEEFNRRLRDDPAALFEELEISVPAGVIPKTVNVPSPEQIAKIQAAMEVNRSFRPDFPWFPWFATSEEFSWFMPWFPWLFEPDGSPAS